jgi:hypothetical protein
VPYWAEPGEQQRRAIERACSVCRSSLPGGCCPLVRPSMKPRQLQLARRSSAANAASGWDGLGFATPFQAVTKPRPADPRIWGNRTNRRVLNNGGMRAVRAPGRQTVARDSCPLRRSASPRTRKARISGPFFQADDGSRTRDLRLGKLVWETRFLYFNGFSVRLGELSSGQICSVRDTVGDTVFETVMNPAAQGSRAGGRCLAPSAS